MPRLFDVIRVKDECFRPVFYFALRDTLVADDLEQATRIAYGRTRHRVVTLAGQLIETSGILHSATPVLLKFDLIALHKSTIISFPFRGRAVAATP